ncbi:TetR/AcrR family transcriptional regulator [Actinotalea sp. BY-33]|uniref:TetR/AcrR family transcriptional regulator n=1 Tax=Actinotalea soli TaxID=2819234 RepID=A0A939LQG8_9CELL|nr:TetR/AcrR family transcriptional regulator [Actinotalea soli]MBO1751130.1 TetR/AcrR family transcriptional regulator [Actinotalea soli]
MTTDRRQQILAAADAIVSERGFPALSVRGVAARAGIGPSTLRHYFPTQQDLYDAVVGRSFDTKVEDLRITDETVAPAARLTECLLQFMPEDESALPALGTWLRTYAATLEPDRNEHVVRLLVSLTTHARSRVDSWLATLEAEGVLRSGPADRHRTALLAVVDGLCLAMLTPGVRTPLAEARAVLAHVVENLVVTP